jgi:MYXO-CTERM domain-containing protein
MPGWRDFESQSTVQTEVRDGQVAGSRSYERLLVPAVAGESAIPALEYNYFDPETGRYETARTEPIPIAIAPGAAGTTGTTGTPAGPAAGAQTAAAEQAVPDIRHIKQVPAQLSPGEQPLTRSPVYWAAWGLPVLGAAGLWGWQRRQRHWEKNAGLARSSQARKKAKKALAGAHKHGRDPFDAARQILTGYLSDKLGRPVAGLTHQALAELLAGRGVDADLAERIEVLLVSGELGRFAPGAGEPGYDKSLLQEVGFLVDALDKVL